MKDRSTKSWRGMGSGGRSWQMATTLLEAGGTTFRTALVGTSNLMLFKGVGKLNTREFGKTEITSRKKKYFQTSDSI